MFDIRYHIASLVAVFLALTIGILLGSVIVDKGALVKQQNALVESLEVRHNDLQEQNRMLSEENTSLKKFQDEALPVINGRLKEKRIAIIVTTDVPDEDQNAIQSTLEQAGASISRISTSEFEKNFKKTAVRKKLDTYFPEENLSKEKLCDKVLERMAAEIATPTEKTLLAELINLGLIDMRASANLPAEQVVFFGGSRTTIKEASNLDTPLIRQIRNLGIRVIGIEESDAKISYMETYQKEEIPTVDNVDQVAGKISLIFVLLGQDGNYGIKPSAKKLLPLLGQASEE